MGKTSTQKVKHSYMPGQTDLYKSLLGGVSGQITGDYWQKLLQPYTGQFVAPLSEGEKWGIDYMKNILTGQYDPRTSDYYKGLREGAYENLQNALTGIRQSASLGGMLASTPRIKQEAQLQRQVAGDINTMLAGLYEQERARQLQLLPYYMQASGLERSIQQMALDKQYAEFVRQLQMLGVPLNTAVRLAMFSPTGQTQTTTQPFQFGNLLSFLVRGT